MHVCCLLIRAASAATLNECPASICVLYILNVYVCASSFLILSAFPQHFILLFCVATALSVGRSVAIGHPVSEIESGHPVLRRAGGDSCRLVEYGSGASLPPSVRSSFVLVI